MFGGQEKRRLVSMLFMLVILGMAVSRASDPGMWTWFAPDREVPARAALATAAPGPAAERPLAGKPLALKPAAKTPATEKAKTHAAGKAAALPPAAEPDATGTDQDWEEAEAITEDAGAITDRTLYIDKIEMNVYKRLVKWVRNQPWEALEKRAKKNPIFDEFNANPAKHRFQLFELDLDVRLVRNLDKVKTLDQPLSEVWGVTAESRDHLYDAVVVDLPAAMPTGDVFERAKVVGYFFKLQGYEPGNARPNARPLHAPLFIGRIQWRPAPIPAVQTSDWKWGLGAVAVIVVVALALGFATMRGNGIRSGSSLKHSPNTPALEEWLEGQSSEEETLLGNNFSAGGDSSNGESNHKDTRHEDPPVPPGDFDRMQG